MKEPAIGTARLFVAVDGEHTIPFEEASAWDHAVNTPAVLETERRIMRRNTCSVRPYMVGWRCALPIGHEGMHACDCGCGMRVDWNTTLTLGAS